MRPKRSPIVQAVKQADGKEAFDSIIVVTDRKILEVGLAVEQVVSRRG